MVSLSVIVPFSPAMVMWPRRRLAISIRCCFSLLRRAIQNAACFSLICRRGGLLLAPCTFSNKPPDIGSEVCCCLKHRFSSWSCALWKKDEMKLEGTGLLQQLKKNIFPSSRITDWWNDPNWWNHFCWANVIQFWYTIKYNYLFQRSVALTTHHWSRQSPEWNWQVNFTYVQ